MPTMSDAVDRNLRKPWEMVRDREVACCTSRGRKELDVTWQLNNNFLLINFLFKLEANYNTVVVFAIH